jgi:type I restriction enzyme, S subunit
MNANLRHTKWLMARLDSLQAAGDYTFVGGPFGSDLTSQDYVSEPGIPVIRGTNLGGSESRFVDDGFVYVTKEKAESLRRNLAFPGDLIFTQRGTLGQAAIVPLNSRFSRYVISQSQMKLTVDPSKADSRYVYYAFRSPHSQAHFLSRTQATGVPHINLGILKEFLIPLPPLPEQRRIAGILDKADATRRKQRDAVSYAKSFTPSLFRQMFGNPIRNEQRWPLVKIEDVGDVQLGRQRAPKYQTGQHTHPYLRVANVFEDRLELGDVLSMDFDKSDFKRYRLEDQDILLNEGQSTELVGRPAMWRNEIPNCCFQNTLVRFRADRSKTDPEFAIAVFLEYLRGSAFARISSKTSSIAHLGGSRFAAMPYPLPPLSLQAEFGKLRRASRKIDDKVSRHAEETEGLFNALVQRAFRGEM